MLTLKPSGTDRVRISVLSGLISPSLSHNLWAEMIRKIISGRCANLWRNKKQSDFMWGGGGDISDVGIDICVDKEIIYKL